LSIGSQNTPELDLRVPKKFLLLFPGTHKASRYKVFKSGRAGLKTWQIARALACWGSAAKLRIFCARETCKSIKESSFAEIKTQIARVGLSHRYRITENTINGVNGTEFLFGGLRVDPESLKSLADVDIVWVEEAAGVSKRSWEVADPTFRKPPQDMPHSSFIKGTEIWVSYNPDLETDPVHVRFALPEGEDVGPSTAHGRTVYLPKEDAYVVTSHWEENKHLSPALIQLAKNHYETDPEGAEHIWGGGCNIKSDAIIMSGKTRVMEFEVPTDPITGRSLDANIDGPYFGCDFGFANDPLSIHKYWAKGMEILVEHEVYKTKLDLDARGAAYIRGLMPSLSLWRKDPQTGGPRLDLCPQPELRCDNARPESISALRNLGFNAVACEKWKGCVEDGIAALRTAEHITIHPRCIGARTEAKLYKYKVDARTGEVTAVPVDKHNHFWDDCRYAFERFIKAQEKEVVMAHQERVPMAMDEIEGSAFDPMDQVAFDSVGSSHLTF
jgi:phage terminase large subunit